MSISTWGAPLILLAAAATAFSAHAGEQTGEKHRFNMTQGGKKMSAEDFDAWMKARGVRVAKGTAAPAEDQPAKDEQAEDKKSKDKPAKDA